MKTRQRVALLTAVAIGSGCAGGLYIVPPPPGTMVIAQTPRGYEVEAGFFYDRLAPYGEWVRHGRHGWVWIPSGVPFGWRPYTYGHWVYTHDGDWLWVSDWEWGWAAFHYGRWYDDDHLGWVWVPGHTWAPAWVAWRCGGGYIGWAPLPPRAGWSVSIGFTWFDIDAITPPHWVFVEGRHFTEPRIRRRILPPDRNRRAIERAGDVTNVIPYRGRVRDRSLPRETVEGETGRTVIPYRTRSAESPSAAQLRRAPDEVAVFRPDVRPAGPERRPPPAGELERRHRIEIQILDERHRVLIEDFEARRRRTATENPQVRRTFEAERREIDRRVERERRILIERQKREVTRRRRGNANPG